MGILYIFCGILFLLNPNLRMLDYLPDLVGALLIIAGTSKLSSFDGRIYAARKSMYYLAVVSAFKLPLSFYVALKADNYLLPFTFVFSCVETLILISFFTQLIGGLEYFVARDAANPSHSSKAQSASVLCFIFAIARGILGFIPELLVLGEQSDSFDYTYSPTPAQNAALMKPYAEILCFVIVFILGIYTAVVAGKYFVGLAKDKEFVEKLKKRAIQHELDNIGTYNLRRTNYALVLLFISIALLLSPVLDSVNILPNVISFVFLSLAIYRISVCHKKGMFNLLSIGLLAVASLSVYNDALGYTLLSQTDIAIKGTDMRIRQVPQLLESTESLPHIALTYLLEAVIVCTVIYVAVLWTERLPYLSKAKTIGLSEIFFKISLPVFLISQALSTVLSHVRTAYSYASQSISVYAKFDSIQEISQWVAYIFYVILIYTAYKYFKEISDRVKCE